MKATFIETTLIAIAFALGAGFIDAVSQKPLAKTFKIVAQAPGVKPPPPGQVDAPQAILDHPARTLWLVGGAIGGAWCYFGRMLLNGGLKKTDGLGKVTIITGAFVGSLFLSPIVLLQFQPNPGREWCGAAGFAGSIIAWAAIEVIDKTLLKWIAGKANIPTEDKSKEEKKL